MARQSSRLYQITLRAASRKVGGSTLRRGQSFTLPISADVTRYSNLPKVWDVKVVAGAPARRRQEPEPGSPAGPPISPKASATFTGLVNRLDADRKAVARLEPRDLAGYRAMVKAQASNVGAYLAQVLGGDSRVWARAVQTFPALELEDVEAALAMAELEADSEDTEDPPSVDLAPQELEDAAERPVEPRGGEDAEDAEDPPSAAPEAPSTAELEPGPPVQPPAKSEAVRALEDALVSLESGSEDVTMAQALELATAAGLEVPPSVKRIRRRVDLAGELAQLLAAESSPFPVNPSPAELEG